MLNLGILRYLQGASEAVQGREEEAGHGARGQEEGEEAAEEGGLGEEDPGEGQGEYGVRG